MKRTTQPTTFTPSKFSTVVGCDRHELARKLAQAGAKPVASDGRGVEYALRDLVAAHTGGDLRREQLRKLVEEADRVALGNARSRGELIAVEEVCRMTEGFFGVLRSKILSFPLSAEEIDACLLSLMSFAEVDWGAVAKRAGAS